MIKYFVRKLKIFFYLLNSQFQNSFSLNNGGQKLLNSKLYGIPLIHDIMFNLLDTSNPI